MTPIRYATGVRLEVFDLQDFFERQNPGAGPRFAIELVQLLDLLARHPRIFARVPHGRRGHEVREGITRRFPALVIYEVTAAEVVLLEVVHAHSVRRQWRRRLGSP